MITAVARPNVALVKYWGKRDEALNLPEAGSISLTLEGLRTRTSVEVDGALDRDEVHIDGRDAEGESRRRVVRFLDRVATGRPPVRVRSESDFPASAGLASSSSAFAALAAAAARAFGAAEDPASLSRLARQGSGSAARSIHGGFVEMCRGVREDGTDAVASQLLDADAWDVRMVVAVVGTGPKPVGSREAMARSRDTSPLHDGWIASVERDLPIAREAIARRDLEALGRVMERSCLTMHADCLAADPAVLYWRGATLEAMHTVRELRSDGVAGWFTNDAGPHLKVLTEAAQADAFVQRLSTVTGVSEVRIARPGAGVTVES